MNAEVEFKSTCEMQHMLPKLRTYFCQLLEELKIRRENDQENEKRIKELVSVQHGLEEQLEEEAIKLQTDREDQLCKLEEQRKMFGDQIRESDEEKMKAKLLYDTSMKEIKSLRDEIRKLHLSKFSLEKIIKDQECKLQLMNSSRESYQLQVSQIETQSTRCSQQLLDLEAALVLLQNNVNAAVSVNEEVRKQNTAYSCKLDKMRAESEKLLERVYKNPLYSQNQRDEERKTAVQARMEVSAKFNEEKIAEMERELSFANKNLLVTQRSLQESHRLVSEQSRSQRRVEEEVSRVEREKRELCEERSREVESRRNQARCEELEKEEIQNQLVETRDKVRNSDLNDDIGQGLQLHEVLGELAELKSHKASIGDDYPRHTQTGENGSGGQIEQDGALVLAPSSQEEASIPPSIRGDNAECIHSNLVTKCSQESEKEAIQDTDVMSYSTSTSPKLLNSPKLSAEMPNKKSKLDSELNSPKRTPPLSTHPN